MSILLVLLLIIINIINIFILTNVINLLTKVYYFEHCQNWFYFVYLYFDNYKY